MKRVGSGEARFPGLRNIPDAAAYLVELLIIAASYAGLAELGQFLPALNYTATPCWPPSGFALALVLLCGYRIWPAILLGSLSASALVWLNSGAGGTPSILTPAAVAIGTVVAALAGAWLLNRWSHGRKTFTTLSGVARFALIAFIPTAMMSSAAAVGGLSLTDGVSPDYTKWATWWLTDAAGTLLITPPVVLWATMSLRPLSKSGVLEAAAIFILASAIGTVAFSPVVGGILNDLQPQQSLFGFLVLLPLTWAALRGNPKNAATAALIFCGTAIWGLSAGNGAFSQTDLNTPLLLLALTISAPLLALAVSAVIARRQATEANLTVERDQLSRQMAQTGLALESSRRLFQILMDGITDYAIFVLDTTGHVASWNGAAQQIVGYTATEIVGQHFGIFYRPDERRAGEPGRALELALQRGKHEVEGWRIRKNGTLLFVTGSVTSIRDKSGNLVGFANILRDATERRDTQEKLVEAREQLVTSQKMEAIGKLTGGIAHDFNNLLMIIGGNAQIFKRLLDPKLPRAIEAIQTAAQRGESLTRQLLTFARRQHLNPTVVDLNDCVRGMRTMIESSLRGNIVYTEKIDPNVRPVKVDLAELELAIVNIAVNARDAMPSGGTFNVSIGNVRSSYDEAHPDREFAAIAFSDTGTGIPPDLLSKIFDPFFTTKEVGKGTGLGLSQVYGFAHQSGGMVLADSKVGKGTTMTLYLPSVAQDEIVAGPDDAADTEHSQRPAVLIVDDSAEVAEVTSSLFEHLGYETVYRESADAALKLLANGTKFDLVFSDIVMPGTIDGVGLASEIRSHYPDLPVVLTTGYSDAARAVPADLRILRKPFDSDALRGFIKDAMDVHVSN